MKAYQVKRVRKCMRPYSSEAEYFYGEEAIPHDWIVIEEQWGVYESGANGLPPYTWIADHGSKASAQSTVVAFSERDSLKEQVRNLNNSDQSNATQDQGELFRGLGETLVEFTCNFVNYRRLMGQQLAQGDDDTPFAEVARLLCFWTEEFHKTNGNGPWDDYYEMVEDFFLAKVRMALSDGTLRLIRNK